MVVITRYGKPVAALVSPEDLAQLERGTASAKFQELEGDETAEPPSRVSRAPATYSTRSAGLISATA